jgi:hypothetical protein
MKCNWLSQRPTDHKENPLRSQQMPKMVPVIVHAFLSAMHKIHIHTMKFLSGNKANLKSET